MQRENLKFALDVDDRNLDELIKEHGLAAVERLAALRAQLAFEDTLKKIINFWNDIRRATRRGHIRYAPRRNHVGR